MTTPTPANMVMIMDIMNLGRSYNQVTERHKDYIKYSNHQFDIILKNNRCIVVIDRRGPTTIYPDLRSAHNKLKIRCA
jgi:hypothetical protein